MTHTEYKKTHPLKKEDMRNKVRTPKDRIEARNTRHRSRRQLGTGSASSLSSSPTVIGVPLLKVIARCNHSP